MSPIARILRCILFLPVHEAEEARQRLVESGRRLDAAVSSAKARIAEGTEMVRAADEGRQTAQARLHALMDGLLGQGHRDDAT